jgi:hypothetical protein
MQAMRVVLLILMIALLPLRAWSGNVMAMQLATGHAKATEMIAVNPYEIRAEGIFYLNSVDASAPCHEDSTDSDHAAGNGALASSSASDHPGSHGDCNQCSTCQMCQGVALDPFTRPLPFMALPTQAVHSGLNLFASVPRAPHLKPPIS